MASVTGAVVVLFVGLIGVVLIPPRIVSVWRGKQSAPWIPLRRSDRYFLGIEMFEVNDRTFPTYGTAFLCIALFAVLLGATTILRASGWWPSLYQPLTDGALVMMLSAFGFGLLSLAVSLTSHPRWLIPPAHREGAATDIVGSVEGSHYWYWIAAQPISTISYIVAVVIGRNEFVVSLLFILVILIYFTGPFAYAADATAVTNTNQLDWNPSVVGYVGLGIFFWVFAALFYLYKRHKYLGVP